MKKGLRNFNLKKIHIFYFFKYVNEMNEGVKLTMHKSNIDCIN